MKNTFYLQQQNFCRTLWKHNFSPIAAISFAFIFLLMTNSAFAIGGVDPTFNAGVTNFNFQTIEKIAVHTNERILHGDNFPQIVASVIVSGRVKTESGRGVPRVSISLSNAKGNTLYAMTNSFGFYRFTGLPSGATYLFNIRHKQYDFLQPSFLLFVADEQTDLNFTARPRKGGLSYDAFNRKF